MEPNQQAVLFYDRDCPFCCWATTKILAWDRRGRIRPVTLQDPEADRLLPGMDEDTKMKSWHLVTPDGRVHSAGAAAPPLFRLLPGGRALAAVSSTLPRTTERAYRWVSRHRERLAKMGARSGPVDPSAHGNSHKS
jgi:predicted DCC family thiol-disulfide oxidoreductase YuxK